MMFALASRALLPTAHVLLPLRAFGSSQRYVAGLRANRSHTGSSCVYIMRRGRNGPINYAPRSREEVPALCLSQLETIRAKSESLLRHAVIPIH